MCGKHHTGNRGLVALIIVAVGLLAGCGGNNTDPAGRLGPATDQHTGEPGIAPGTLATDGSGMPAGLPDDPWAAPVETAARVGSFYLCETLEGDEAWYKSRNTALDTAGHAMVLAPSPGEPAWAVYRIYGLLPDDDSLTATVYLDEPATQGAYVGFSNHRDNCWTWQAGEAAVPVVTVSIPNSTEPFNNGGVTYIAVAASGVAEVRIREVRLTHGDAAPPPKYVTAGYDANPQMIPLRWLDPAESNNRLTYDSIQVERLAAGGQWEVIAEVVAGQEYYSDLHGPANELEYGTDYRYRLRTVISGVAGPASAAVLGRRMVPDVTGFNASSGTYTDRINLSWEQAPGCDGYRIDIYHTNTWQELVVIGSGEITDYSQIWNANPQLALEFDRAYHYRIQAHWQGQVSANCSGATGYCGLALVEGLTATEGEYPDRVLVSWTPVTDAEGYEVAFRKGDGDLQLLASLAGNDNCSTEHGYAAPAGSECEYDTVYEYKVRGTRGGAAPPWESASTATGYRLLQPPEQVKASRGTLPDYVAINWNAQEGVGEFEVYRDGTDPACLIAEVSDATAWADYVSDYDTHTYYIISVWQGIESEVSREALGYRALFGMVKASPADHSWFSMVEADSRLAVAATRRSEDGTWYYQAQDAIPTPETAWTAHEVVDTTGYYRTVEAATINGLPCLVTCDAGTAPNDVYFARALTSAPASAADWVAHELAVTGERTHYPDLCEVDGNPAVTFRDGQQMYARALNADPSTAADWVISPIADGLHRPSLIEYQGKPVLIGNLLGYTSGSESVVAALSLTSEPAAPEDWVLHSIENGLFFCTAAVVDGMLAASYLNVENELRYARALVETPAGPEDWQTHKVIYHEVNGNGRNSLCEIDGRPALAFVSNFSWLNDNLYVAIAEDSQPSQWGWQVFIVDRGALIRMPMLLERDGRLALGYLRRNEQSEYEVWAGLTQVPVSDIP